jgi:hypothetical protein
MGKMTDFYVLLQKYENEVNFRKVTCKILNVCSTTKFTFLLTGVLNRVTANETMPGN